MAQTYDVEGVTLEQGREATTADVASKQCPNCMTQGAFRVQPSDFDVVVGNDTAIVTVNAIVCGVCGYRELDGINSTKLDEVRARMEAGDRTGMEPVGVVYRVPVSA